MPRLRTLLVLGRTSNLPTVWSNCLAGWWLGGHGNANKLPLLFGGTTLLYLGGMYLNDAFDANFDLQYRKERPIPAGAISLGAVWKLSALLFALGLGCLFWTGLLAGELALALLFCILLYDAVHKLITLSPVLMGACRFFLYAVAAATAGNVSGWTIWCGLALMAYIVGLSFVAKRESARGPFEYWPLIFLAAPIALAFLMNAGMFRKSAALLSLVLGLWILKCLRTVLWGPDRQIGRTVSGLLAGIVFVDWLAALDAPRTIAIIFLALFASAVFFQRFVPAT